MANELRLPDNEELASQVIESEQKKFELITRAGVLGKFFGSEEYAPRNITGLLLLLLVVAALVYTYVDRSLPAVDRSLPAKDLWGIVGPLIGTMVGYMFGFGKGRAGGR